MGSEIRGYRGRMRLPQPRGPVSSTVVTALADGKPVADIDVPASDDVLADEDLQLALWISYQLHYAGFDDAPDAHEWEPGLLGLRVRIEEQLLAQLWETTTDRAVRAREAADAVPDQLLAMVEDDDGPSLAAYLHREADRTQYDEFLVQRGLVALRESDHAAWVLPRLRGPAKAVLSELLHDEFGAGRSDHVHSSLYASALRSAGLDAELGGAVDAMPVEMLAVDTVGTFLALHQRLRGAALGHLAAFEASSSLPCRKYAGGAERLEYPPEVAAYWDEHVEADAVHEQLAVRGICGQLVAEDPRLADDVLMGAAACLETEARWSAAVLEAFEAGRSSLRHTEA
jgi:hypothetical protein